MSEPRTGPPVQVVRGDPSDEELAALITVLARRAGTADPQPPVEHRSWGDPAHRLRTPLHPGPGAWRASLHDHRVW